MVTRPVGGCIGCSIVSSGTAVENRRRFRGLIGVVRRSSVARYGSFAIGSAASTLLSFAYTVFLVRVLPPSDFAKVAVVMAASLLASAATSGVDLAAARVLATHPQAEQGLVVVHAHLKIRTAMLCTIPAVVITALLMPRGLALVGGLSVVVSSLGLSGIGFRLAHAQARGDLRAYIVYQILPYVLIISIAVPAWSLADFDAARAMMTLAAGGVPGVAILLRRRARTGNRHPVTGEGEMRALSRALTLNALLTAVYERLDLLVMAAILGQNSFGIYAAGVRLGSGGAVLSSSFVAFSMPAVGAVAQTGSIRRLYGDLRTPIMLIAGLIAMTAPILPHVSGLVLGDPYQASGVVAAAFILQFPVVACYMPAVLVLTHRGRPRWQVELAVVLVVVESLWLAFCPRELWVVALASLVAHLAGAVYVAVRVRQTRSVNEVL